MLISYLLEPFYSFPLQRLLNRDMTHRVRWHRAVPMFFVRRKPDHVARPDFLDRSAFALRPAQTGRDDQRLTEWMGMPCRAGAGLEGDAGAPSTCRVGRLEQRVDADGAGEIVRRALTRRL